MVRLVTLIPDGQTGTHHTWLDECVRSTAGQGEHVVREAREGFFEARRWTYTLGGVVACVDWDDRLVAGAAEACVNPKDRHNAAVAFTLQRLIGEAGEPLGERRGTVNPRHLAYKPDSIHHLTCFRSELVPLDLMSVVAACAPLCVDWVVKAYLALHHGAVQVPMVGYEWRQHAAQASRTRDAEYGLQIPIARALIKTWVPLDSRQFEDFPVFKEDLP